MGDWDYDNLYANQPVEVWDPIEGRNVYTGGSNAEYIQSHPENYSEYTGPVGYVGDQAINANTYVPGTSPQTGSDVYTNFDTQRQIRTLNPYSAWDASYDESLKALQDQMRMIAGSGPQYWVIPETGEIINGLTYERVDPSTLDPETQKFAEASRYLNTPTFSDFSSSGGAVSGRGYNLSGEASPEEQALLDRWNAGDTSVGPQLAMMRDQRWQENQLSDWQQAMGIIMPTLILSTMTLGAGAAGAPAYVGAGLGAFGAGAQTGFEDPLAIALGAAGGYAGNWAGQAAGQALGLGPVTSSALGGAAGGVGNQIGYQAGQGEFEPEDWWKSAAAGAAGGAVGGGIQTLGTSRVPVNTFGEPGGMTYVPYTNPYAMGAAPYADKFTRTAVNVALDDDERKRRRFATQNPYRG